MKTVRLFLGFALLIFPLVGFSQDGTLDTSFNGDGFVVTDFYGESDQSYSIIQQSDGKIVSFGFTNSGDISMLSRYLPNGDLDTTFGTDGRVVNDFGNTFQFVFYTSLHQQTDGKLLTSSEYQDPNGDSDIFLVRYLENGDIDTTYGDNGSVRIHYGIDKLASSLLLPDGKIIVGGTTSIGDSRYLLLTKYLVNGEIDLSFGDNGITVTYINDESTWAFPLILQTDGKVLISYRKQEANDQQTLMFQRYLENGQLDPSFGVDGVVTTNIVEDFIFGSIALKENGNIVAAIHPRYDPILAQFLPNGDPDLSFGTDGKMNIVVPSKIPFNILLDENEKILISGNDYGFEISDYYLTRFNSDGSLDPTFGVNGATVLYFESNGIIMQSDNKILITGCTFWYAGEVDFVVARLNNGILGVSENSLEDTVVFPNPSDGVFTIKSSADFDSENSYTVTDISGKNIQKGILQSSETIIDLSEVQTGIYFLKANNTRLKLIKN